MKPKELLADALERFKEDVCDTIADLKDDIKEEAACWYGMQAYIYGFPLVLMDVTQNRTIATPPPLSAPMNQIWNARRFPDASTPTKVVRTGLDTLFTSAWIDLAEEPFILSAPDTNGRYYLMALLDMWTNVFASVGKRTTGTGPASFLIAGPTWSGTAPAGIVQTFRSPTRFVWLLGQTQTNGPNDYAAVNAIQNGYALTPLSSWGKPYAPKTGVAAPGATDTTTPAVTQVKNMDAGTFFNRLAMLMKDNPAAPADASMVTKLQKLGIEPGREFDINKVDSAIARGLERAVTQAFARLEELTTKGRRKNGWSVTDPAMGNYGTDYRMRAGVALAGLGANLPEETIYSMTYTDSDGAPLDSAHRYVLHFDKGQTPPSNATWSLALYDPAGYYVPNSLNRYNLAPWMPLQYNADGSLDFYLQADSPGQDKEANWLPSPQSGPFNLIVRNYWPQEDMLDGSYELPPVQKRA